MIKNIILFMISICFSGLLHAKNAELDILHSWMVENYEFIEINLEKTESLVSIPTIVTLVEIWKIRDGALSGEVSPLLIIALKNDPHNTLTLLSNSSLSFNKWLNELEGMVFTDHSGSESNILEKLRVETLVSLKSYSRNNSKELKAMADALIEKLEVIEVRSID
ncbi:hypothetical protein [Vibrio cincinnatiensis]|uniref:hypothetical protein n=1 Tax=Vibrio cincinnatiensis TaxID=675 RepID=UPI001EDD4947|nr:hypothetical protein [Vibrio cincinnatiensis]MCG3727531.1 hypothetical protein [Vibrio cincinnatiensis]